MARKKVIQPKAKLGVVGKAGTSQVTSDLRKRMMLEALEKTLGNVSQASRMTEINRENHYKWLREDVKYREAYHGIQEMTIDFVESQLHKNISNGDTTATIFFLKTRAKHRGYVERQELTGRDGQALVQQIDLSELSEELLLELQEIAERQRIKKIS